MKLRVVPVGGYPEISYRMKCVSVEDERIFGDVLVTQQTQDYIYCANCFPVRKKRRLNLITKTIEAPDLMKINSKLGFRRRSTISHFPELTNRSVRRSESVGEEVLRDFNIENKEAKKPKVYPDPLENSHTKRATAAISSLVDQLLLDIYGVSSSDRGRSDSDSTVFSRIQPRPSHLQKTRLLRKSVEELRTVLRTLQEHVDDVSGFLIRQLRRRDYLLAKREKRCDVITAHLQALSNKTSEDTKMRFSLSPQPGESGFTQWLDAMNMVAKLPGGIPSEFRKRLWITLAERHLEQRGVDWKQAERLCFNEWSNPDDEELGIQIVKDLHRTGCSLFCGVAGRDNQAVLRRVLLGFARWNKSVGYCQGLNVLAALILQVVDRNESSAVKVMIYLIEGVLPEGYFADNLRGLSVDMAVFRDLLRMKFPMLSKHLESLQTSAKEKATGSNYEPPLTNVFTMQWFLTIFCHCLPQEAVLRVWDIIFLTGNEILLRTALVIWGGISDRIMTVKSADEFYSIMGVLTREMLEFTDTDNLIKGIVSIAPLNGVTKLREKHRYNITPWAQTLSDDEDDCETEEDERLAVAAAANIFNRPQKKKDRNPSAPGTLQTLSNDREKLALDISTLKQQYAKLRERQRQAHIILSATCARQTMVSAPTTAMNHLLVGKTTLVSGKTRQIGPSLVNSSSKFRIGNNLSPRSQLRKERQGYTLHWRDMKKCRDTKELPDDEGAQIGSLIYAPESMSVVTTLSRRSSVDSDSDSTSTELCDEPDRLSDIDSEEQSFTSDIHAIVTTDEERNSSTRGSPIAAQTPAQIQSEVTSKIVNLSPSDNYLESSERTDQVINIEETSIAEITDQIRRLSAGNDDIFNFGVSGECQSEEKSAKDSAEMNFDNGASPLNLSDTHYPSRGSIRVENIDSKWNSDKIQDSYGEKYQKEKEDHSYESGKMLIGDSFRIVEDVKGVNTADREESCHYILDSLKNSNILSLNEDRETVKQELNKISSAIEPLKSMKWITDVPDSNGLSNYLNFSHRETFTGCKYSPKTSESSDSGETMGPDSKISSLNVSSRTPLNLEKSNSSSLSSNPRIQTLRSVESDKSSIKKRLDLENSSIDKSCPIIPISLDSLITRSDYSPKFIVSSSSESYSQIKSNSSERIFSSDLQSPASAYSIKYTHKDDNYRQESSPIQLTSITSPFYPISHPNQKTPSPHNASTKGISDDAQVSLTISQKYSTPKAIFKSDDLDRLSRRSESSTNSVLYRQRVSDTGDVLCYDFNSVSKIEDKRLGLHQEIELFDDQHRNRNENSSIPVEHPNSRFSSEKYNGKISGRKCSSLEIKFPEVLTHPVSDESTSISKKRSSDILEDIKHLEVTVDGSPETNILTKKTGYILKDVENLEARRQDTFSDSASGFSRNLTGIPVVSLSNENRKSYLVEPRMKIDENSDSILKKMTQSCSSDSDDGEESKIGVWTKVKPKKSGRDGRRSSSDRALKIIQENSVILHKILTCQAKKRLPDLEEISKGITISPINEEISKIFSPILEKMGLNEHEINEELARIDFRDLDHMTSTTSEFDAKINDELCKLSLISDDEDVNPTDLDDVFHQDYLESRDAIIDRQINEELSRVLSNYEPPSRSSSHARNSSNHNDDITNADLHNYSSITTQSKKSTTNVTLSSSQCERYRSYADPDVPFSGAHNPTKFYSSSSTCVPSNFTPRSDIDIHRELERLDHISSVHELPYDMNEIPQTIISTVAYNLQSSSYCQASHHDYVTQAEKPFDISPRKSLYDPHYSSNIEFRNLQLPRSYERSYVDPTFDLSNRNTFNFDMNRKKSLSRESLEFRVRYDDDPSKLRKNTEQSCTSIRTDSLDFSRRIPYHIDKSPVPIEKSASISNDKKLVETSTLSAVDSKYERYDSYLENEYEPVSPRTYGSRIDVERRFLESRIVQSQTESRSHVPIEKSRKTYLVSLDDHLSDITQSTNSYPIKLNLNFEGASLKSLHHPELLDDSRVRDFSDSVLDGSSISDKPSYVNTSGLVNLNLKTNFSPFPIRNVAKKPKELSLKSGLYSSTSTDGEQRKQS